MEGLIGSLKYRLVEIPSSAAAIRIVPIPSGRFVEYKEVRRGR